MMIKFCASSSLTGVRCSSRGRLLQRYRGDLRVITVHAGPLIVDWTDSVMLGMPAMHPMIICRNPTCWDLPFSGRTYVRTCCRGSGDAPRGVCMTRSSSTTRRWPSRAWLSVAYRILVPSCSAPTMMVS